jgi:hypothetical protein
LLAYVQEIKRSFISKLGISHQVLSSTHQSPYSTEIKRNIYTSDLPFPSTLSPLTIITTLSPSRENSASPIITPSHHPRKLINQTPPTHRPRKDSYVKISKRSKTNKKSVQKGLPLLPRIGRSTHTRQRILINRHINLLAILVDRDFLSLRLS